MRPGSAEPAAGKRAEDSIAAHRREPGVQAPPGWDSNPSAWPGRLLTIGLAACGFGIAMYLALFQWSLYPHVWEPFFGDGSRRVLHSSIARLLPVPDAFLGALAYVTDVVTGAIGGSARWRTMPWIVLVYGCAIAAFGLISTLLVIFQPVLFGAWCTLCLASATISVVLVNRAAEEFLAALQQVRREHARGLSYPHALRGTNEQG